MKKGHCIAMAMNRPPGSRVRTTTMDIGMAMTRVSTVVSPANSRVLRMTSPKPASVNSAL